MPDIITGNTQLDPVKQALIAEIVQRELAFQAKLLPTVTDFSALVGKGDKSISIPKSASFTVENRATGTASEIQTAAFAVDTILLNRRATITWLIDSMDEFQSKPNVMGWYTQLAGQSHGRDIDNQVLASLEAVFSNSTGLTGVMSLAKILDARRYLLERHAIMQNVVLTCSPEFESELLTLDEFKRADVYGQPVIPNLTPVGFVYGIPVVVHSGMTGRNAYVYEKGGVGIAFQLGANMGMQPAVQYGSNAGIVTVDQLYGIAGLRLAELSAAAGKSPLVYKITNTGP